jgi:hypothetical protein
MVVQLLGFQKSRFFANKTHNFEQLVLAKLSTCDVDVRGKLGSKARNSIHNQTFMISH